jgi:Rv0078B-related antitoxin
LADSSPVTPEAATKLQIELYRSMSGEQRLKIALGLHELSCELAREGIRRQYPDAGEAEVERLLRQRLALAHGT